MKNIMKKLSCMAFLVCSALSLEAMNCQMMTSDPLAIAGAGRGRGRRQSGGSETSSVSSSCKAGSFERRFAVLKALTDGAQKGQPSVSTLARQMRRADLTKVSSSCSSSTYDGKDHGTKGKKSARGQRPSWDESTTASEESIDLLGNAFDGNNGGRGQVTRQSPDIYRAIGFRPISPKEQEDLTVYGDGFAPVGPALKNAFVSSLFSNSWVVVDGEGRGRVVSSVINNS